MKRFALQIPCMVLAASALAADPSGEVYAVLEKLVAPKGAYVDTGLKPASDWTVSMSVDVQTTGEHWFGMWDVDYKTGAFAVCNDVGSVYCGYGSDGGGVGSAVGSGAHVIALDQGVVTVDGTAIKTFAAMDFSLERNLYLFAQNRAGAATPHANQTYVVMKACSIAKAGALLADYVPVQRKADGAIGLYDKVTDAFLGNAGSGDFKKAIPVILSGNYTLKAGDEKSSAGDYEVTGELRPENGSTIDGSDWHVLKILAFQGDNKVMDFRSGSIVVDGTSYDGCYPNNGKSYVNFTLGSTGTVTMPFAEKDIYAKCFASGKNFRVSGQVLSDAEFARQVQLEAIDATHTRFSLVPPKETDVIFGAPSVVFEDGTATVTAPVEKAGDNSATVYAVWDTTDKGATLASWGHQVAVGTLADFSANGAVLADLPALQQVSARVIAMTGDGVSFCTTAVSFFTLGLRAENQPLPNDKEADFIVDGDSLGYEEKDVTVKKLVLKNGSYVFPGNKIIGIYDGAWIENAYAQFYCRLENKSSDVTFAFTNAYVQYRGTWEKPTAFSTGSGKNNVRVEMINTTPDERGMHWDGMTQGIKIGDAASDCSLLVEGGNVTAGAVVTNMHYNTSGFHLGTGNGASRNVAVVKGGAELWDNITVNNAGNDVGRGTDSNDNRLEVLGGEGFVTKLYKGHAGNIGRGASHRNTIRLDGKGFAGSAFWKAGNGLNVGCEGGTHNALELIDGGVLEGPAIVVGNAASFNSILVSGAGSVLRGSGGSTTLTVGSGGANTTSEGNVLTVEKGGLVESHSKWSTIFGGHEQNAMTGMTKDNGVIVREGGIYKLPNTLYIGRIKGEGSLAEGNFLHVEGDGSQFQANSKDIYVGTALRNNDTGAEARANELVVSDGGFLQANNVHVGGSTDATKPGATHDNVVRVTTNGRLLTTYTLQTGLASDAEKGRDAAVALDNTIVAEHGGIIEARTFKTHSANGNTIRVRNGGVLQVFETNPHIEPFEPGAIAVENGVISYRLNNCNPKNIETSTQSKSWQDLTVTGKNAFRISDCRTADSNMTYVFGETEPDNPRHFVRLEMADGTTAWRGGAADTLTIAASGSMLCTNTIATVSVPLTLDGPLTVVNSSLALTKASSLNAPVTLVDATLDLPEGMTVGSNFALTIGGELESGRDVITSATDLTLSATLPDCWRLKKRATETGFAYYTEYRKPGLAIIVK